MAFILKYSCQKCRFSFWAKKTFNFLFLIFNILMTIDKKDHKKICIIWESLRYLQSQKQKGFDKTQPL